MVRPRRRAGPLGEFGMNSSALRLATPVGDLLSLFLLGLLTPASQNQPGVGDNGCRDKMSPPSSRGRSRQIVARVKINSSRMPPGMVPIPFRLMAAMVNVDDVGPKCPVSAIRHGYQPGVLCLLPDFRPASHWLVAVIGTESPDVRDWGERGARARGRVEVTLPTPRGFHRPVTVSGVRGVRSRIGPRSSRLTPTVSGSRAKHHDECRKARK